MKKVHTHVLRVLHKWIGLLIGVQFLLWTLSGAVMAFLPMEEVAGGAASKPPQVRLASAPDTWPIIRQQLREEPIESLASQSLLDRTVFKVATASGVRLFDSESGTPVLIDAQLARRIASTAYPGTAEVQRVEELSELTLAVRDHKLPIWRVDFADQQNSSYYVSGSTGALLERHNDTWRIWNFFWMLHIMDYVDRSSFNHPVIWLFGFAAVWLAITGIWLLFRTGWKTDLKASLQSLNVTDTRDRALTAIQVKTSH